MTSNLGVVRRIAWISAAMALALAVVLPAFHTGTAYADQLQSRSVTLSDSGPSAGTTITTGVGSGTNVTYKVSFTTLHTAGSLVIDFCSQDPIINDNCTVPTGMSVTAATVSPVTGNIGGTGWTETNSPNATTAQVKLNDDGSPAHDASVGPQVFTLSGITNPSTTGSFYARIYTFTGDAFGTYASPTSVGNYADYGGVAMSTNQIITITARVQETLTFCVSGAIQTLWVTTHTCSDTEATTIPPALILGHGTPTPVLDASAVDTGTVYSQISTNATNGAVIAMRNNNLTCGGLSANAGTTCAIPAIGTVGGTQTSPYPIVAGTAAFGMYAAPSTLETGGTGAMTIPSTYGTTNDYGMNQTAVTSTYGDTVASTATPVYRVDDAYTFGATASLTTPAGIYTANMDLIATGTF